MAKFYAHLDQIVDGRAAVAAALDTDGIAGLARVHHGSWQYIVALPEGGQAVLGRATPDPKINARVIPIEEAWGIQRRRVPAGPVVVADPLLRGLPPEPVVAVGEPPAERSGAGQT
ncbi:hypothetical protein Are01nite_10830 [Actinoplanes regularis]|nr:hypothetical protein Are01nite_10830 [Actinoplanes regularis]